ncbi:MAG: UbiA family prenyltransferase, partial [Deltaproteobacteria bacterium]|nr:UbiA family prenyltransferase [Deltaproteobacteria bacterium]
MIALLRDVIVLTKLPISAAVTLTTALGFLLFDGRVTADLGWCLLGTLLAATSASALNQVQDAARDARMARTASRPLPGGRIDRATAVFVATVLALLGFAALATVSTYPLSAMGLTALAMAWYNGGYAGLKRVTAFAVVPGAAIGSIPPMVGWVSAGGSLDDPAIWLVATLLFLWQVPHFWLLVMRHGDEYAAAGLPSLTERFSPAALARITFAWTLAAVAFAPGVALSVGAGPVPFAVVTALSVALAGASLPLLRVSPDGAPGAAVPAAAAPAAAPAAPAAAAP